MRLSRLARSSGVSNFSVKYLQRLLPEVKILPAVNQVETHPFHQQNETQQFLLDNNVQIESWGPFAEGKNNLFHNELLASIGKKYNKSIAQVVIRWLAQRGIIAIPKSIRKERIKENFNIFDFELNADDMEAIKTLDTNTSLFFDHQDPAMVKWLGERKLNN